MIRLLIIKINIMRKVWTQKTPLSVNIAFDTRFLDVLNDTRPAQGAGNPAIKRTQSSSFRTRVHSKRKEKQSVAKGIDQETNKHLIASIRKNLLSLEYSTEQSEMIQTAYNSLKQKMRRTEAPKITRE